MSVTTLDTTGVETSGAGVVVGVDGTHASINAVRYGLAEARRVGGTLRLVHVLPDYAASAYPIPVQDIVDAGRTVLTSVLDEVGATEGVPVATALRRGSRASTLVAAARAARVLVVGADRRPVLARLLTGNTSTGVAASSVAPVVAVPETWEPTDHGVVVAGVKNPAKATDLLGEAFAVAHARRSRLVIVHAWQFLSDYDDLVTNRAAADEWDERARTELAAVVAEWRSSYPDVEVEIRIVHDQPAHALVEAAAEADELIVVRRAHGIPAAVHLGSTARTVLREATCPVRVVSPGHVAVVPGLVIEDAGSIRK